VFGSLRRRETMQVPRIGDVRWAIGTLVCHASGESCQEGWVRYDESEEITAYNVI
jgi:hypothetical protein